MKNKTLHGIDDVRLREILYILDNVRGGYDVEIEDKLEEINKIVEDLLTESEGGDD